MSSQHFDPSPLQTQTSPTTARRRRSKFTYKHLSTLAGSSANCPLRVVAHIDLDAFYAQCETVRLGIDPAKPLAVQQWQGLIAINYPARAFGLNRHVTITEAKEKCPEIICQHVATWKEGDTTWEYNEDAAKEIATRKVSLDPYRIQSRRILKLIKDHLPAELQRVEKASIDEVFLDLSAQVHAEMIKRYQELRGPAPYDDPTEPLPRPSTTALDWAADALVDLNSSQREEDDPDWDDVAMLIGSEIVRDVRQKIFDELHYTCSAGIARNKMLSKLGSGHKKPNSQTVIRNRAIQQFLSTFKFTKIRNLGGKLGDEVVAAFNTDLVADLLPYSIDLLKKQLGDDTGSWLYLIIRGEDHSEVNPRTQIKSMLSAKSFRPSINTFDVACRWLRIFVADIYSRLVEEGVLEHRRRPRTLNLHHRQGQATRSRSAPIPMGKTITEDALYDLAKNLLAQVVVDGRAWPCANLSLSVSGFEDGVVGNKGIGGFLVHGAEAKALRAQTDANASRGNEPEKKRRRLNDAGITRFLGAASPVVKCGDGGNSHRDEGEHSTHPSTTGLSNKRKGIDGYYESISREDSRNSDATHDHGDGDDDNDVADGDEEGTNPFEDETRRNEEDNNIIDDDENNGRGDDDEFEPPPSHQPRRQSASPPPPPPSFQPSSPPRTPVPPPRPPRRSFFNNTILKEDLDKCTVDAFQTFDPGMASHTTKPSDTSHTHTASHASAESTAYSHFVCGRCHRRIPIVDRVEHDDYHFALDLQQQESPIRERTNPLGNVHARTDTSGDFGPVISSVASSRSGGGHGSKNGDGRKSHPGTSGGGRTGAGSTGNKSNDRSRTTGSSSTGSSANASGGNASGGNASLRGLEKGQKRLAFG